jgi:hypothetical protein
MGAQNEVCAKCIFGRSRVVITPLFFIFNLIGRQDPPPITHPGFYVIQVAYAQEQSHPGRESLSVSRLK